MDSEWLAGASVAEVIGQKQGLVSIDFVQRLNAKLRLYDHTWILFFL